MPLTPKDLTAGSCYLAHDGQVRCIEVVTAKDVIYRPREGVPGRRSWTFSETVRIARFLAEADREVPCDYERSFV
ncbi:hypothetical protein [uncultured Methylobacterium sp.]|uniref:hypothetical protein n=1 Tax=uncultured Methylobacterium sp. TaxID=157278 RepID=UPI0035CB6E40